MDVAFLDAELARLCMSRAALERRWGADWTLIARRLIEIAASPTLAAVAQLPSTSVTPLATGEFDVTFSEGITVKLLADGQRHPQLVSDAVSAVVVTSIAAQTSARTTA